MRSILDLFKRRRPRIPPRAELIDRGERFRLSREGECFVGICFIDYYRDEWCKLTLMADSIQQSLPAGSARLSSQQQDAIAAEAMALFQMRDSKTQVGVARSDA